MRGTRFLQLLALSALLALHSSCSLATPQQSAPGHSVLPAPREMVRRASAKPAEWTQNGAEFDVALPHANVTANGTFADYAPTGTTDIASLSFAIYSFEVTNYDGGPFVTPTFDGPVDTAYIGLADFDANAWRMVEVDFNDPNTPLEYNTSNVHMVDQSHGYVLVAVVSGFTGFTLEELSIGEEQNTPPVAFITHAAQSGLRRDWAGVGEELYFTVDSSYDPDGYPTAFNIDWQDDGIYDKFLIPSAVDEPFDIRYSWPTPGDYTVRLKATDDRNAIGTNTWDIRILGKPNTEVEPNNSFATAQDLGAPPIAHYAFDFSPDADAVDYFKFTLDQPGYVHVQLHVGNCTSLNCHPQVEIYDPAQNLIASAIDEVVTSCLSGEYYVKAYDQDQVVPLDCELEISYSPTLPGADLTCDPEAADMPFRLHCEAYPADETGCDFAPQEINWSINGEPCDGDRLVPCEGERAIDLYVCTAESIEVSCEVKDKEGNVTTSSKTVSGQGTYHSSGTASDGAPNWPLVPDGPNEYYLPVRFSVFGFTADNRWLCINAPRPGTLTVWLKKTGNYSCYASLFNQDKSVMEASAGEFSPGQAIRLQVHIEAGIHYLEYKTNGASQPSPDGLGIQLAGQFVADPES